MDMIKKKHIKSSRDRGTTKLQLNGSSTSVNIREAELKNGDFPFALLATSPDYKGELLGYSGFVTRQSSLLDVEPTFLELRMLKVDPAYFRNGIGKLLLDHSKTLSRERDKTLIMRPQRPGEIIVEESRIQEYPLTTEQLSEMYQRNGFRKFTSDEVDDLSRKVDEAHLTSSLWFEGIDPETAKMTGVKVYSMTPEEAASLGHIPFEDKLSLMTEILTAEYGHASSLDSNRETHREDVEEHLVIAEG
ncbi:GNAT family N-acetyltransferase [Candidatus Woesearchaeota archaeon]|nr:GNAT family N-acetyltransferase [Candidatus Woesearchaeota archaeon]